MRDLLKKIIIGIAFCVAPPVLAEDYKVLVIPDNVVTENIAVDSFIYNASAEFFADDIITRFNTTDYINSPSVSEIRELYKSDPSAMLAAKTFTNKFKTSYNIDYLTLKKLAKKSDSRYALLITSYIDAENYILRRTLWDFLNIPGATVVDPAYKITTYVVLVDTERNAKLWSDTYSKTISVCENRIITRGASPQVEQLRKIKDYSKYLTPQIAQNVQEKVLPPEILVEESSKIEYGIGDIDNEFTKKYRHLGKESNKIYNQTKTEVIDFSKSTKEKYDVFMKEREAKKLQKQQELDSKLEVKATPIYESNLDMEIDNGINSISNTAKQTLDNTKNATFKKETKDILYPELINIEIKKKKKHNLFGEFDIERPDLRSYN